MTIVAAIGDATRDRPVITEGRKLAERLGEPLFVVLVMETDDFVGLERTSIDRTGHAVERDVIQERAEDVAEDIAKSVIEDDFEYDVAAFIGEPVEELIAFAEDHDAEYLVIGGRKRSPVGKLVFGSTSQSLLLNYDRPIVSVRVGRGD